MTDETMTVFADERAGSFSNNMPILEPRLLADQYIYDNNEKYNIIFGTDLFKTVGFLS